MIGRIVRRFATRFYARGEEALKDVFDGAKLTFAGFGVAGVAENCLRIVHGMNRKNLTICSNSIGLPGWGPGALVDSHQVSKVITSFIGGNPSVESQYLKGEVEIDYIPQGSLVDRIRAVQAGVGGFFSPTGVATPLEEGNFPIKLKKDGTPEKVSKALEKHVFDGKEYLLYPADDPADFVFVKAHVADRYGNLHYKRCARNFNPNIAGAGKVTVVEAEHIVDELPPDKIHTPGFLVDRVFQGDLFTHKVERLRVRPFNPSAEKDSKKKLHPREIIIRRAVKEVKSGMYINLGIGIPAEIPTLMPDDSDATVQVENGLVNAGQYPYFNEIDPDIINAAKEPIVTKPGFSVSSSSTSFGMMRGKHIHMTVLGGLQVSEIGDLANWMVPGKRAKGMGGAMDLAASCPKVVVTMEHTSGKEPRILPRCTYPLTAQRCVSTLITEFAVFEFRDQKMYLIEKVKDITLEQLKKITPANYIVDPNLKDYQA